MRVNCGPAQCCVWPVLAPAEGIVRAGGWSAGRGGSLEMSCVRFTLVIRFYWDALRSTMPVMRLYRDVFRLSYASHAFLSEGLAFDHACLFSFVRKRETACGMLRFLFRRGSGSPLERSQRPCGYRAL